MMRKTGKSRNRTEPIVINGQLSVTLSTDHGLLYCYFNLWYKLCIEDMLVTVSPVIATLTVCMIQIGCRNFLVSISCMFKFAKG